MGEKKVIKISLGAAICIVIIFLLVILLGITYYFGFIKKDINDQQINNSSNEKAQISSEINTSNEKSSTNSVIADNKIKMPISKNIVTIGTTRDTVKSYTKLDSNLQDDGTSSVAYYDIAKSVNGLTYYLVLNYFDDKIKDIGVCCRESKDDIGTNNSDFNEVKEFYKNFTNVDTSQEEGLIIVNIDDEFNKISILHKFTNNKLTNVELYLNVDEKNIKETNKEIYKRVRIENISKTELEQYPEEYIVLEGTSIYFSSNLSNKVLEGTYKVNNNRLDYILLKDTQDYAFYTAASYKFETIKGKKNIVVDNGENGIMYFEKVD